jgi:hypothetical protein
MAQIDFVEERLSKNAEKIKEVITKILKESGLEKKQEEGISAFLSGSEEVKDFSALPSGKIIRIIRENWAENPSEKELTLLIKEKLEISLEDAEKITLILKKEVFENKEIVNEKKDIDDSYRESIE